MRGRFKCDPVNGCGKYYAANLIACPSCGAPPWAADFLPYNPLDWVYDLETYPNVFTAAFKHVNTGTRLLFEISDRRDDSKELYSFLNALKGGSCRMIGFNNIGFDYPIIHFFIENFRNNPTVTNLYDKAMSIINTPWGNRFNNVVWDNDVYIPQIDLFKIHHFDNDAKRTSLKMMEFNMCSDNIGDLPYPPGTFLNDYQKDVLIKYNHHDVSETEAFYFRSIHLIEFREQLTLKYQRNFMNHNDTKIGKDYFIMELEKNIPGSCYMRDTNNRRVPRQTKREHINLKDVIFPYIKFKQPEFERIKQWLSSQIIANTKGVFPELCATIDDFKYVFGVGGIHGSIDSTIVKSDDDYVLYDWDVASYYPNIAIVNNIFPHHLSEQFCVIYKDVFEERRKYKKGTPENAMLKLALNGVYGDSNNKYSPFYDPQYTMSITINGQLLLCLLAQHLIDVPGLKMVQINTDGLTVFCPRTHIDDMKNICKWWEEYTCLELESAIYSRMFIRDVNNYIGEYEDGKLKRKGAYEYKLEWHQNHSALVIPKAAESALVNGQCVKDFITNHANINDFMLRSKMNGSDQLVFNKIFGSEQKLQKVTRYYISNGVDAGAMTKISPPTKGYVVGQWRRKSGLDDYFYNGVLSELKEQDNSNYPAENLDTLGAPWDERINTKNRSLYKIRRTNLNVGWLATPCNEIKEFNRNNVNYDYYITEAKKLIDPLQ